MSFVVAAPELVQAAAQDLASTRSTLDEAFASAAAPTTAVAAAAQDEVSTRVAALFGAFGAFGAFGQEYQALSARATAFHEQFVNTLNAGAGAYVSAEAANTGSIAGPYQTLLANTATNLQALRSVISANPAPFLRQFLSNQTVYAQTIAAEIETVIQNFPTVLANLPANIQAAIQAFLAFDPLPYLQHFVNNQMAYAGIVSMSLQNAANHFVAGLQALPAAFESAFQALQAGNISGAVNDITGASSLSSSPASVPPAPGMSLSPPG
jgi:hypothetical protein